LTIRLLVPSCKASVRSAVSGSPWNPYFEILDQENHQEGNDRGSGVYDQLPGSE